MLYSGTARTALQRAGTTGLEAPARRQPSTLRDGPDQEQGRSRG